MKKIIVFIGLSSDLSITGQTVKQAANLSSAIVSIAENRIAGIISSNHNEADVFSEIMRQTMNISKEKESRHQKTFPYQGSGISMLANEGWKGFILKKFQYYEILIIVCKGIKKYAPNPITAQYSFFELGEAVNFKQLFFN